MTLFVVEKRTGEWCSVADGNPERWMEGSLGGDGSARSRSGQGGQGCQPIRIWNSGSNNGLQPGGASVYLVALQQRGQPWRALVTGREPLTTGFGLVDVPYR